MILFRSKQERKKTKFKVVSLKWLCIKPNEYEKQQHIHKHHTNTQAHGTMHTVPCFISFTLRLCILNSSRTVVLHSGWFGHNHIYLLFAYFSSSSSSYSALYFRISFLLLRAFSLCFVFFLSTHILYLSSSTTVFFIVFRKPCMCAYEYAVAVLVLVVVGSTKCIPWTWRLVAVIFQCYFYNHFGVIVSVSLTYPLHFCFFFFHFLLFFSFDPKQQNKISINELLVSK